MKFVYEDENGGHQPNDRKAKRFLVWTISCLAGVIVLAAILLAVMKNNPSFLGTPVPSGAESQSSMPESSVASSSSEMNAQSEAAFGAESFVQDDSIYAASSGMPSEEAETEFAQNTVDKALKQAIEEADTNAQILSAYETAINNTKIQIERMLKNLSENAAENYPQIKQVHDKWEQEASADIQERQALAENGGGSVQQIEVSAYIYNTYHVRAEALFVLVKSYDPTFVYGAAE